MAGLATRTAALSLLLHERLCRCPRLGASLLARLGWILRGRLRARSRTRARLLLQTLHPRPQARDLTLVARAQLEQKLNARLPPHRPPPPPPDPCRPVRASSGGPFRLTNSKTPYFGAARLSPPRTTVDKSVRT